MRNLISIGRLAVIIAGFCFFQARVRAQATQEVSVLPGETHQTLTGRTDTSWVAWAHILIRRRSITPSSGN